MTNDKRKLLYALIKALSGQENILTIPRLFITVTKSHRSALFLSQSIYWSDRATHDGGWFYKSYAGWLIELGLNQHAVQTCVKYLTGLGVLETKISKAGQRETRWYRPNIERLAELIEEVTLAETAKVEGAAATLAETANVPQRKTIRSSIKQRLPSETTFSPPEGGGGEKPAKPLTARQSAVKTLEERFSEISALALPPRETEAQRKAGATRWWNPLAEIWTLCDKDTDQAIRLMTGAYNALIGKRLTVSAPASVLETARAIKALQERGVNGGEPVLSDSVLIAIQNANAQGASHGAH